ncbi:protein SMAX1-LIKE 3-like [Humulus lupulus]|uniref:protein SMAX1-LIKE 3-like n=1 Tax=Humulus lupulus TaxID=3486 RepID=UPI002B40390A|nr:protein SMAX1-LIKE 3-like [Humulus lupulus]
MRGGICTLQQALTAEATSLVKQAVSLAKRRGHAQVTPLHVASAMLATSTGLLRKACLQCHSHPLQCKALELCFNVALNRLPASSPSPLLAPHYVNPSFSNALVAAFKRAQAHQRRGSVENQQQPILALKIELEQLIISILDDPSVSRVMREAGFSSTLVKSRVEQAVSMEICSQSPGSNGQSKESVKPLNGLGSHVSQSIPSSQFPVSVSKPFDQIRQEDVNNVLNVMLNKRKNTVIVGESLAAAEGIARGVMETFERGNSSGNYRYLQFISLPLFSLRNISKEEVEQKLMELRCVVKSYMGRGVVLYLGDLSWVSEFWSSCSQQRRTSYFAMEHIIMELKRLVSGIGDTSGRVWLMGISTFQTYMKCKTGHPSLETIWELHPLTIPVGSLSLSLKFESDVEAEVSIKASKDKSGQLLLETAEENKHISCCTADCSCNLDKRKTNSSTVSTLPSWLQKCTEESKRNATSKNQEYCITVGDLCKKWNSFCSSGPKYSNFAEKPFNFSSLSPTKPFSSHDCDLGLHDQSHQSGPVTLGPKQSPKEYQFWVLENSDDGYESNVKMFIPEGNHESAAAKPELLSNPNSSPNSASSSEVMEEDQDEDLPSFKELNSENLRILCDEMEKNVPWQKGIIPDIATTILQCRSGMSQRRGKFKLKEEKEESCWLFFLGADSKGKEKIARTLAKQVFGSQNEFVSIGLSSFSSSTRADDSTEEYSKNKRTRNESGCSYVQRFGEAVNQNPHRVFFMEDLEEVDYYSQKGIKNAIESGRITLPDGETVPLKDAIVVFSCESFSSVSRASSPTRGQKLSDPVIITEKADQNNNDGADMEDKSPCGSLDLNIAFEDDDDEEDHHDEDSDSHVGLLEAVDRKFTFLV